MSAAGVAEAVRGELETQVFADFGRQIDHGLVAQGAAVVAEP